MKNHSLIYDPLERLVVPRPVHREPFMAAMCRGKRVLDLGCLDETAQVKRNTEHWLHGRIGAVAASVVGIDSSDLVPSEGLQTGPNSIVIKGDATNPDFRDIDIIVAGELIEHVESPLQFLRTLCDRFPGRELVLSTPNGLSLANIILALVRRESQHPDHLQISTFKTLNTLFARAGCEAWELTPNHFYATEMILNSTGAKRLAAIVFAKAVRAIEWLFPLLSAGYIVRARL